MRSCTRENDNTLCITRYATRDQNFRYNELNRQKIVGFQPQTSCFQTAERFRRGKFQWRSYGKFIRTESGENSTGNYSEHRRALPSDELWTKFPFSSGGRHSLWTLYITQLARSRRDRSVHTYMLRARERNRVWAQTCIATSEAKKRVRPFAIPLIRLWDTDVIFLQRLSLSFGSRNCCAECRSVRFCYDMMFC